MGFKIMPFGGPRHWGHYADHHDIRAYLFQDELKNGSGVPHKLPLDFQRQVSVPLTGRHEGKMTHLVCKKGKPSPTGDWRGKSSAHRCFAMCPNCLDWVPAGRTHQHKCKF